MLGEAPAAARTRLICKEAYFCTCAQNSIYIKITCKGESDGEKRYNLAYL